MRADPPAFAVEVDGLGVEVHVVERPEALVGQLVTHVEAGVFAEADGGQEVLGLVGGHPGANGRPRIDASHGEEEAHRRHPDHGEARSPLPGCHVPPRARALWSRARLDAIPRSIDDIGTSGQASLTP